jgi:hypothetical protein
MHESYLERCFPCFSKQEGKKYRIWRKKWMVFSLGVCQVVCVNTFPRTGLASLSSRQVRALHQFQSFKQSNSISKGRSCLVLTLAFVRPVFLIAPRELVRRGELSWQPNVQMVSEEVWVQFALSG